MTSVHRKPTPASSPQETLPATMRAAAGLTYGGPEVVTVESVPCPQPGPGEVLVRVRAAGLDRATLHLLTGLPLLARLAFGVRRPRRPVLGQQVAGEVVALGEGTSAYAVGDRVFGTGQGTFAQYAVAKPATLAPTPQSVTDVEAATLGVSGLTALTAVTTQGLVSSGQRVLVLGGSGAVGSFAVQLAGHLGGHVTAAASGAKLDFVREIGAQAVVDYRQTPIEDMGGPFDTIIDIGGNRAVSQLRKALTPTGRLVIVGGEGGGPVLGGIERNLVASVTSWFTSQHLGWFVGGTTTEGCTELAGLVAAGAVRPAIDSCVGLDGVSEALARMQDGGIRGQVVVRP